MYDDMVAQPSLFDICPVYYSNVIVEVDKKDIQKNIKSIIQNCQMKII